eukprot:7049298-Pyramimonas_sp.AAC.2
MDDLGPHFARVLLPHVELADGRSSVRFRSRRALVDAILAALQSAGDGDELAGLARTVSAEVDIVARGGDAALSLSSARDVCGKLGLTFTARYAADLDCKLARTIRERAAGAIVPVAAVAVAPAVVDGGPIVPADGDAVGAIVPAARRRAGARRLHETIKTLQLKCAKQRNNGYRLRGR